ncbi:RHS repeat-associated core domain-containing protein [Desulfosarcina ovata]|nr:RHS repeat-associated core domain-containing protein [Desulfosarcina ovata]
MDNVTAKATEHGDYNYGYDNLYRLTDVDNPDQADEAFTYDGVGNRLTAADTLTEWGYNENNELTGYDDVTFDYDLNGNMIEKNAGGVVTRFFYNLEDRLERVEDGSGNVIASYYYDPFGRRLWKDVGGTRTCFHYSDEGLEGEYDATGTVIKTYGWKPGSTWSTDPLFMKIGTECYYYHNDHLGTPQKMTSASGAVVWSAKYGSFGEASIDVETIENNLRFAGQFFDAETGLHYNCFRYYDPTVCRYLRVDPLEFMGGINMYRYCTNPIKNMDPLGLKSLGDFHYYRRWGGPGYTAGMWTSWDKLSKEKREYILRDIAENIDSDFKPLDDQDQCYMYHDICYGESRMDCKKKDNRCYDNCEKKSLNNCDYELTKCLIGIGLSGNALNEARRIAAIPIFLVQPGVRNAVEHNEKHGTSDFIRYSW